MMGATYGVLQNLKMSKQNDPDWVLDARMIFLSCITPIAPYIGVKTSITDFVLRLPLIPPTFLPVSPPGITNWDSWLNPMGIGLIPSNSDILEYKGQNIFSIDNLPFFTYFGVITLTTKIGKSTNDIEKFSFYVETSDKKIAEITIPVCIKKESDFILKSITGANPATCLGTKIKSLEYFESIQEYQIDTNTEKPSGVTENVDESQTGKSTNPTIESVSAITGFVENYKEVVYTPNSNKITEFTVDESINEFRKDADSTYKYKVVSVANLTKNKTYSSYEDLVEEFSADQTKVKISWRPVANNVYDLPDEGDTLKLIYRIFKRIAVTSDQSKTILNNNKVNVSSFGFKENVLYSEENVSDEKRLKIDIEYQYRHNEDTLIRG